MSPLAQAGCDLRSAAATTSPLMPAKSPATATLAGGAVDDRDHLLEELADTSEVMSALTAHHGIQWQEVVDDAREKAQRRGRLGTGAWLHGSS